MTKPARSPWHLTTGRRCVISLATLWLAGCSLLQPPADLAPPPDLTFRHVHLQQFKNGELSALSTTAGLQYTRDTGHVEAQTARITPVSGDLAGGALTAGTAIGSTATGKATLSDSVHWTALTGEQMQTAQCQVDLVRQTATGNDPILIYGPGYTLGAPSFDLRYGAGRELQLHGGVHGTMSDDNSTLPAVPVNSAQWAAP